MIKLLSNITLSALLFLSATGVTINLHYCQGQLFDFALIAPADNCCETAGHENHCCHDSGKDNSNHCDDESIKLESTSDYVVSAFSFNFESFHSFDLLFITQLLFDSQNIRETNTTTLLNYKKPPKPHEVILSEIHVFLI